MRLLCRICLKDGAAYSIFENNKTANILSMLSECLKEKIEDLEGYPRNICSACLDNLKTAYNFICRYKETGQLLKNSLLTVKKEILDSSDNNYDNDLSEIEIDINSAIEAKCEAFLEDFGDTDHDLLQEDKSLSPKDHPTQNKPNKSSINQTKIKKVRNKFVSYSNNVASSILEEKFLWNGEKWCLLNKRISQPQETIFTKNNVNNEKGVKKKVRVRNLVPTLKVPKLCDMCGKVYPNHNKLRIHKNSVHFSASVKCEICSKEFNSAINLKRHIRRTHGSQSFMCSICGKKYALQGILSKHVKDCHTEKNIFSCKVCNKSYKCAKSVIIHERSVHTGERPAECSFCSKRFYHEDYLKEHVRLHTGEAPFKCPICGRGYAQRGNMKSHMRIHRASEVDPEILSKLKPNYRKLLKL